MNFFKKLFLPPKAYENADIVINEYDYSLTIMTVVNNKWIAKMICVLESDDTIMIGDILHNSSNNYNNGHGTMLLNKLISYAKENNYSFIYGNLSDVDLNHKSRLHHFYKKCGFTITEYPEKQDCYYGKIELNL